MLFVVGLTVGQIVLLLQSIAIQSIAIAVTRHQDKKTRCPATFPFSFPHFKRYNNGNLPNANYKAVEGLNHFSNPDRDSVSV